MSWDKRQHIISLPQSVCPRVMDVPYQRISNRIGKLPRLLVVRALACGGLQPAIFGVHRPTAFQTASANSANPATAGSSTGEPVENSDQAQARKTSPAAPWRQSAPPAAQAAPQYSSESHARSPNAD